MGLGPLVIVMSCALGVAFPCTEGLFDSKTFYTHFKRHNATEILQRHIIHTTFFNLTPTHFHNNHEARLLRNPGRFWR
jgi:hypothetical protein